MIRLPIIIYQGESYSPPPISIVNGCIPPGIITLGGYTATMTIRQSPFNENIVLQVSTYTGQIIILPTKGQIIINIAAEYLTPLSPFQGSWDLFLYSPSVNSQRLIGGPFTILESDTQ